MPDVLDEEDEDALDVLPPMSALDDEGEELGLDAADLGVQVGEGDAEDVGLDDSTGFDDGAALFELELPPRERVDAGEVDAIPLADEIAADDEYGWVDTGEDSSDDAWESSDADLPDLTPLGRDDTGGAEGLEEVFDLGGESDDDVPHLPPLRADAESEDDELLDLELGLPSDFVRGAVLPPTLPDVALEQVLDAPTRDVTLHEGELWAATALGIYRGRDLCAGFGLEGSPTSIARAGASVLVGTTAGAFRSADGAETFVRIGVLGAHAVRVLAERDGSYWACGATGRLQRSDDEGVTWSSPLLLTRVAAIAAPERGVVTLSAPDAARPQLASSDDRGARWTASDAPTLTRPGDGAAYAIAATGSHVAVASPADDGGPFLSDDRGRRWLRIPGLPPAEALALRQESSLAVYAAHAVGGRRIVARHLPTKDVGSGVLLELEVGRVHRLLTHGRDELLVASDAGCWRIRTGGRR